MSQELAKTYSPAEVELKWTEFWEKSHFFHADPQSKKPSYCIVLPPPNVTGSLHMGHALVDTVQDVLIRWKRMSGYEALWIPGVDHAGIATQTVVEKHLIKTYGKRRKDFSREEFLSHVWTWKELNEKNILAQLKKVGCSCDWSRNRFTMDSVSNKAVRSMFKKMFDDGLIYKGDYLVNWDPATQTALADDEVEHEEKDSFLWHIRYLLEDGSGSIIVATTRPETLLGDTAVAVSPSDSRYQHLIGKFLVLPLIGRKIPIISDHYVDPHFGTGAVKITPAHDFNDYEVGQRHHLPMINIMTPDGRINSEGKGYEHLTMQECREKIARDLLANGFLVKQEPHRLRVGISYRSKAVIEPYLSKQWFVKMSSFKQKLIDAVTHKKVKMIPDHWQNTYFHWIEHLRDWCISRQLWWGHQIPIWQRIDNPDVYICYDGEDEPEEVKKEPHLWKREEDVLDTWFSSALWPFSTMGWPDKTPELEKFYPTAVLVTGHDILFFWVARMILMGEYALGEVPFKETFLHGLIYGKSYWREDSHGICHYVGAEERIAYDSGKPLPKDVLTKWEKMSKTKGNVIDPLEIIDSFGADAMRMALMSSLTHARQIDLDRRRFEEFKNFSNKLWNSARFVLMHLVGGVEQAPLTKDIFSKGLDEEYLCLEDQWILNSLQEVILEIDRLLHAYEFDKCSHLLYSFFWDKFCAYYVELVKPTLTGKVQTAAHREQKQKILLIVLLASIRLMHPFVPFITEEIFHKLKEHFGGIERYTEIDFWTKEAIESLNAKACLVSQYPKAPHKHLCEKINEDFAKVDQIIYTIRQIRGQMQLPPQTPCDIYFILDPHCEDISFIQTNEHLFKALIKISHIHYCSEKPTHLSLYAQQDSGGVDILIPLPNELKQKEKERLVQTKEKLEKQLVDLAQKLANKEFLEKAPPQLVEAIKNQFEEAQKRVSETLLHLKKFD